MRENTTIIQQVPAGNGDSARNILFSFPTEKKRNPFAVRFGLSLPSLCPLHLGLAPPSLDPLGRKMPQVLLSTKEERAAMGNRKRERESAK